MKQLLQSLKDGTTTVAEIPAPRCGGGQVVVQTYVSLVSAGTERMLVEFGKGSLIQKARSQPDKVKQVLEKARTDGVAATLDAVRSKLDQPLALGYCNVGQVIESRAEGVAVGDRVVSNGKHAEIVTAPRNLCARIPDTVSDEAASFTVLAAIGLQGIRLAQPTLGECVVVTGLGLIGLLTVQMLRAQGCRVLGIDLDPARLDLARRFGAETVNPAAGEDVLARAMAFSRGAGVDAVIITASTKSNEPVSQAARMCRKRGRIVLVGVVGLELSRAEFYEKELTFQVSCSYGPGRYDPEYEENGKDYPIGFVRWTEQRNFEAVLDMMADGRLNVEPLISHRFVIDDAPKAYEVVAGSEPSLGILLTYPGIELADAGRTVSFRDQPAADRSPAAGTKAGASSPPRVSCIGAGNYATAVLIPAFKAAGAELHSVASSGGISGVHAGRKFGFAETTTDSDRLFADEKTDAVVITTRHNSHARFVLQALKSGKHVFCEKPLCLTLDELTEIETAWSGRETADRPVLMVGFNRRFAPQVVKMKSLLGGVTGPKSFVMTVNAGAIPDDHWTQDLEVGGGRIIGEACHFIDLLRFLADSPIVEFGSIALHAKSKDTVSIQLKFENGSIGTVHYFANGSKRFPKERLEVFAAGGVLQLDNFRQLRGFGWPGFRKMNLWRQDKGQTACAAAFLQSISAGSRMPIPVADIFEVSRVAIELARM